MMCNFIARTNWLKVESNYLVDTIIIFNLSYYMNINGAIGFTWLDGLLRNPWSGVQTPQVLGYSGLRVAEPLVGGSNHYGAGVSLRSRGLGPHVSSQGIPWRRFPGKMT